jgi:hypothetical protein
MESRLQLSTTRGQETAEARVYCERWCSMQSNSRTNIASSEAEFFSSDEYQYGRLHAAHTFNICMCRCHVRIGQYPMGLRGGVV